MLTPETKPERPTFDCYCGVTHPVPIPVAHPVATQTVTARCRCGLLLWPQMHKAAALGAPE